MSELLIGFPLEPVPSRRSAARDQAPSTATQATPHGPSETGPVGESSTAKDADPTPPESAAATSAGTPQR